jgi:hypothetical protein
MLLVMAVQMLAVLTVAPESVVGPPPSPEPLRERETLSAAYQRAERRLSPFTRQYDFDNVNIGARGRINATRAEQRRDMEWLPGVIDRTLSDW